MEKEHLINAEVVCTVHRVDISFIYALKESGLIEVWVIEDVLFIDNREIGQLEKLIRLHYDLEINLEGMEAIGHLLQKVQDLSEEVRVLRNKLSCYG